MSSPDSARYSSNVYGARYWSSPRPTPLSGRPARSAAVALDVKTSRHPDPRERADMELAVKVAKHVKSNAIVFVKDGATVGIGAGQMSRVDAARIAARMATGVLQCSPLVLLLFFGYMVASTLVPYSAPVALVIAVVMIGLYNGSSAAQAIGEYHATQRSTSATWPPLRGAIQGAAVQIMSFLVNATKSSAVASMVGVPELLNELTDITSFTSERIMTYSFLLVFYTLLVSLVVTLMRSLQGVFERRAAA